MNNSVDPVQPIQLTRAEFFELLAKTQKVDILRFKAIQAAQAATEAEANAEAVMQALGTQHQFDPNAQWRMDESTCSLVPA